MDYTNSYFAAISLRILISIQLFSPGAHLVADKSIKPFNENRASASVPSNQQVREKN